MNLSLAKSLYFIVALTIAVVPLFNTVHAASVTYCANLSVSLQQGDSDQTKSGQVSRLQNFLKLYYSLNDTTLPATGYFGAITQSYVTKFQMDNGIDAVGSVGPITRAKINFFCQGTQAQTSSSMMGGAQAQTSCPSVAVPTCTGTLQPVMQSSCVIGYNCTIATGNGAANGISNGSSATATSASMSVNTSTTSQSQTTQTSTNGSTSALDSARGEVEKKGNCPAYVTLTCGPNEEHWGKFVNGCPVDSCKLRDAWCVDPEQSTKHRRVACPAGQTGAIYESSGAMCTAGGTVSWGSWSQYKNTCSTSSVLSCAAGTKTYANGAVVSMYTILSDIFGSPDGTQAADQYMPGGAPRYKCIERDWVCSTNCHAETILSIPFYL